MAIRDKTQGIVFVYENVYSLYKKSQLSKLTDPVAVIKTGANRSVQVKSYEPKTLKIPKKLTQLPTDPFSSGPTVQELKDNLSKLKTLHGRLRFMLGELEDLVEKK